MTTSAVTAGAADEGLVPLADRLRFMQLFRHVVAVCAMAAWAWLPDGRGLSARWLLASVGGYTLLAAVVGQAWRLPRRRALSVFNAALLMDGLVLAVFTYGSAGFGAPLQYVLLLHVIAVTLLASFRTGLKVSVWHTILICSAYQLQAAGVLHGGAAGGSGQGAALVALLALTWVMTMATAAFASINERELRRRNFDLGALAALSWRLEESLQPAEVAGALVGAVCDDFSMPRAVVAGAASGRLEVIAAKGGTGDAAGHDPGADRHVALAMAEHRSLRLATLTEDDPWLSSVLPGARNVLICPMNADGAPIGVLVAEYGRALGARIERRVVGAIERYVSQTALALSNAWLLAQVRAMASTDALTGVANRRTFDTALAREVSRAQRTGRPLSALLVDIDHFKRLNDTYGHQTGDQVLQRVAAALGTGLRITDLLARYGGEEFVLLLPATALPDAVAIAERLRAAVESIAEEPGVTASLGVAEYPSNAADGALLVRAADEALYQSKESGRNRVTASGTVSGVVPLTA